MSSITVNILVAVFLLAANAFYVAAEFALVKSRGFRVKAMADRNSFGAHLLQKMMGDIEPYLACCQLGITMASLGLGWVGEPTVAALLKPLLDPLGMSESALHFTSFLTGFLVFSSLHIVIGEQVPKTLAIRQPEPVSQWIAYPLYVSYIVFYPLNWLLNAASRGVLSMIGVKEASPHEILTGVEIEGLVGQSAEHGGIESGEAEYLQNVFRFGELAVSDVMVHRTAMTMLNADLPSEELVREVLSTEYTRIPLWREKPENMSACCMQRICCVQSVLPKATRRKSMLLRSHRRRGSCRRCGRSRISSRPSAAARPTSLSSSMNMAKWKAW